ncbi:MAG: transposase [Mucilaginibacter sp.]|nr:transposase [Mucilaginibacter sp.]
MRIIITLVCGVKHSLFYTVAIVDWMPLINTNRFKHIVMDSLIYLIKKNKLKVYGFVIMPNHIHIIGKTLL